MPSSDAGSINSWSSSVKGGNDTSSLEHNLVSLKFLEDAPPPPRPPLSGRSSNYSLPSTPRSNGNNPSARQSRNAVEFGHSRRISVSSAQSVLLPPATQGGLAGKGGGHDTEDPLRGLSRWAPVAYKATFEPGEDGSPAALVLKDQTVLTELSKNMTDQLNCMFAFMHQVVGRERARHASNVSMMMRKVDKDLKETYDSVKEIFGNLTQQLVGLVKEVENSREQVKAIQDKYLAARQSAEAQAQYVLELEAVLDGQCEGVSATLRKLTEQSVGKSQAMSKNAEDAKKRERQLKDENDKLKHELKKCKDMVDRMLTGNQPPSLPEMSASWTRRGTSSSVGSHASDVVGFGAFDPVREEDEEAEQGVDIVGSVLAHCDSGRAVSRAKPVRTPRRPLPRLPGSCLSDKEASGLRRRLGQMEARCERMHHLVTFSSTSLMLLRDIVAQLRASGHLSAAGSMGKLPKLTAAEQEPAEVLEQIVRLFHTAAPKLKGLPEVLQALSAEIAEGPPAKSGFEDLVSPKCIE